MPLLRECSRDFSLACCIFRADIASRTAKHYILRRRPPKGKVMETIADLELLPTVASDSTQQRLLESASAVQCWVENNEYRGYEPFDGLSSPLRACTFGNLLAERILQQAVRQSPVNIRPLIGIKPLDSTKGRGMMAWGYLLL